MGNEVYTHGLSVCNEEHRAKVLTDAKRVRISIKYFNCGKYVELSGTKKQFQAYDKLGEIRMLGIDLR
jgi:hypothetical protein